MGVCVSAGVVGGWWGVWEVRESVGCMGEVYMRGWRGGGVGGSWVVVGGGGGFFVAGGGVYLRLSVCVEG